MTKAAVMGGGSWGTAFAAVLADAGTDVTLWAKDAQLVDQINATRQNPRYHSGVDLPESLRATADAEEALSGADFVVLATPSQVLRVSLAQWVPSLPKAAVLVSLVKGIEVGTKLRMSQVIGQVTGAPPSQVAVVSGPNLAAEILLRQPAATVVACSDEATATRLQTACLTHYFRPYTNTDVVGVEVGGSVKNVIGLANGMASGMGFGENTQASLITRGLAEMCRLGVALGAHPETFSGLAGMGDLVATCNSPLSRNRTFGVNMGRGMSVAEATALMRQTCEGVKSCRSVLELAREHDVDMPITEVVVRAVHEGLSPREVGLALMGRGAKSERALG